MENGANGNRSFVVWGGIIGFLGVALGAFGAHALKASLSPHDLEIYQTGVHYQQIHALALILTGLTGFRSKWMRWSGIFFLVGIGIFSGSLYLLAVTQIKILGAITPIGGLSFMAGWIFLALGAGTRRV